MQSSKALFQPVTFILELRKTQNSQIYKGYTNFRVLTVCVFILFFIWIHLKCAFTLCCSLVVYFICVLHGFHYFNLYYYFILMCIDAAKCARYGLSLADIFSFKPSACDTLLFMGHILKTLLSFYVKTKIRSSSPESKFARNEHAFLMLAQMLLNLTWMQPALCRHNQDEPLLLTYKITSFSEYRLMPIA